MKKLEDKVYDAYYSENDTIFRKKVRERVHWICSNTSGTNILDIGCSQGITSIILGREGKRVKGVDLSETAISEATENLAKEEAITQECISFEQGNFMLKEFEGNFDSVILGEVLEHITDIRSFFNKAVSLTKNGGRIIITTPFGINDFPDHKRTFYIKDFLELQNEKASITQVKFFGKWIGVIFEVESQIDHQILDNQLLEDFEESIYELERVYINNENKNKKKISQLISEKNENAEIKKANHGEAAQEEIKNLTDLYNNEKLEKAQLQKELIEQYHKEEKLLKDYKKLLDEAKIIEMRYNNLRTSKLGKLTTKYWDIRRRKRRK